jgi:hypothetical protein
MSHTEILKQRHIESPTHALAIVLGMTKYAGAP